MIRVTFVEPDHEEWRDWKGRAAHEQLAHINAVQRGDKPKVGSLYKERKADIIAIFRGKCAYCESRINATQPGDVDHFRPKAAIRGRDGKPVRIPDGAGGMKDHPGYYWLAYAPTNLLLACESCNRSHKRDFFPVEGDNYATCPDESDSPLLFNPCEAEDPTPCFEFVPETGELVGLSPKAMESITYFGLNREPLNEERRKRYQQALARIGAVWMGHNQSGPEFDAQRREFLAEKNGEEAFTFVFRFALRQRAGRVAALNEDFKLD